jgi:hypothetical protein
MVAFRLSGGNAPDAVEGRLLPESIEKQEHTGACQISYVNGKVSSERNPFFPKLNGSLT